MWPSLNSRVPLIDVWSANFLFGLGVEIKGGVALFELHFGERRRHIVGTVHSQFLSGISDVCHVGMEMAVSCSSVPSFVQSVGSECGTVWKMWVSVSGVVMVQADLAVHMSQENL